MSTLEIVLTVLLCLSIIAFRLLLIEYAARGNKLKRSEKDAAEARKLYVDLQKEHVKPDEERGELREAADLAWALLHLNNLPDRDLKVGRYCSYGKALRDRQVQRLHKLRCWTAQLTPMPLCPYLREHYK